MGKKYMNNILIGFDHFYIFNIKFIYDLFSKKYGHITIIFIRVKYF